MFGVSGCDGGFPSKAMDWVAVNGIDTEASYPYANSTTKGTPPACSFNSSTHVKASIKATGHQALNQTEDYMAAFVAK